MSTKATGGLSMRPTKAFEQVQHDRAALVQQ